LDKNANNIFSPCGFCTFLNNISIKENPINSIQMVLIFNVSAHFKIIIFGHIWNVRDIDSHFDLSLQQLRDCTLSRTSDC